jgi:putative membrane protein insertion efficiency factor
MEGNTLLAKAGVLAIKTYQAVFHPFYHFFDLKMCNFNPSCSEYTRQAIAKYGLLEGTALGVARIARCNPSHKGGDDPLK